MQNKVNKKNGVNTLTEMDSRRYNLSCQRYNVIESVVAQLALQSNGQQLHCHSTASSCRRETDI